MSYTEDMNILMNKLNKSISQGSRLAYFKTELLKVLDKKEAPVKKSFTETMNELLKPFSNK